MNSHYDMVVVGAGAAGLTAAIGLARAGFRVAVVEAAVFPGAENWSGCVYFCENLAHPDILGPEGVEGLAWERRLVQRGLFATDGHGLFGLTYRDPQAFANCYTVLRPIFDHHLAQVAAGHGVALLPSTTAEGLIRERGRVVGVATNRGPLYADLTFLAEGDASHLVTREGYERYTDHREAPQFLQGIKQVIELPAGAIEEAFGVGAEEGAAYEFLVRNGSLSGRPVQLNMGGFLYTNRRNLSIGLVLPVSHLHDHFGGDPNLLMEWFENLPVLQRWLQHGRRGAFGAKLIRGGGARDIPRLIDDGLAIGGAASAIGLDFPYPNFTGPATAMGLLLTQAAGRIRAEAGGGPARFTQQALERHYLKPLQETHHWHDVHFLRNWPGYVKRTSFFFGPNLDLALGTAYVWTRPNRWFGPKWFNWLRLLGQLAGPANWPALRDDLRHLSRALGLRTVAPSPNWGRLLLDGTINALRDLFRRPRAQLPPAGTLQLHYAVADDGPAPGSPPAAVARWFRRIGPVLAAGARRLYTNDAEPLQEKLLGISRLLVRQINILDLVGVGLFAGLAGLSGLVMAGWDRLTRRWRKEPRPQQGLYPRYAEAARQAGDLTPVREAAAQHWESRLGQLAYQTVKDSHIHLHWPTSLAHKNALAQEGLWHVCPARVYEARLGATGQLQVVVNFENCIKCETCWRASDRVDWGRDGRHQFIYPVQSPAVERLLAHNQASSLARPALPYTADPWQTTVPDLAAGSLGDSARPFNGHDAADLGPIRRALAQMERKLQEYDAALAEEPRTVDRARGEYLEILARYAQQLAATLVEQLRRCHLADSPQPGRAAAFQDMLALAAALEARAEERVRRTLDGRFAWAAADGRQLRQHHLIGLHRFLDAFAPPVSPVLDDGPLPTWLRAEAAIAETKETLAAWTQRLDAVFPTQAWRELERQEPLTSEQDAVLRDLLAQVPAVKSGNLAETLHPPLRKDLLRELGRRDPSLAYRVAAHLWARDLAGLAPSSPALVQAAQRWSAGSEWACFCLPAIQAAGDASWSGEALLVPAREARSLLVLVGDQLATLAPGMTGLIIEPLATLGLRGAGMCRVQLDNLAPPAGRARVDPDRIQRAWSVLSAADLTAIALGMADQLCQRAVGHATSRVQFPGLFQDEEARDTLGKFGAIKKMVAAMAAHRYLIETLAFNLSPGDFSASSVVRAGLVKALAAEALGTAPGSLAYNAGQVFGGTGYSEDDILSKFYRDAAAFRFLGPANPNVYRHHGEELVRGWRPDGQRLAAFRGEAELFDQLAHRKALLAELDRVRVFRSRLRGLASESAAAGPVPAENLARQDAHLLACKALLLRTHARLEQGLTSETEIALVRVWLEGAGAEMDAFASMRTASEPAPATGSAPALPPTYAEFLATAEGYDSGDFLAAPVDVRRPALVPEMLQADPQLAAWDRELQERFSGHFGSPRSGMPYERYIERQHRPDPADLDFLRQHGFFRFPIPRDLGGEGRRKVDYYLLTTAAHRLADVAVSLTIQVSSSLGTVPVLVARAKDLPRAQKDLGPFVGDPAIQNEMQRELGELTQLVDRGDGGRLANQYRRIQQRLEESVLARPVLRGLAQRFMPAWQKVGRCLVPFDSKQLGRHLEVCGELWAEVCSKAAELHGELGRRREACDLFLRWVASGQISAFALTEPSAGSDTARIVTRAVPRSVPVERQADGTFRFTPFGGKEPRTLLDARGLEFRPEGVVYRGAPEAAAAPIRFDEYDYETDDPHRQRYFEHGGRHVPFTDIAQLRERDGRLWYDYWELTGAKMWITNGRVAGTMCLYAKTDEGVTGFIVDRHAEGLVVGKDEAKMGQCGSPTNELALQGVRVPRENVIGLEGRGQVNALETLNVGRAGLAISAAAPMPGLIDGTRRMGGKSAVPWIAWRLERMEEDRFIAEAVAWAVIGRFEHPQTKSVRLESAIAKMLNSELLHEVIELAEDVHGLAGQTQRHLVEKRKRDARVLNIYEGTNEIQRFFILRDLASEVAPRWQKAAPWKVVEEADPLVREQQGLQAAVRQQVNAALAAFGQEVWQNPNLQPTLFLLAEGAAWLFAADCTLGRLGWLRGQEKEAEEEAVRRAVAACQRCQREVRDRLHRFEEGLARLQRGFYPPEVRAATLLFHQGEAAAEPRALLPASRIQRPLRVLVVVEPAAQAGPEPCVVDGRLLEPYWTLSAADRAALEEALRLRDVGPNVQIEVAAVAPRAAVAALREVLSLGVDLVRLLPPEVDAVTPDSAAAALAAVLRSGPSFDLILSGGVGAEGEEGLVAQLTAAALGVVHVGAAEQLAIRADRNDAELRLRGADGRQRSRNLPAALTVVAGTALRPFSIEGYLAGLSQAVEISRWPRRAPVAAVQFRGGGTAAAPAAPEAAPAALSLPEAAKRLLEEIGAGNAALGTGNRYTGPITDLLDLSGVAVLAIVAAGPGGALAPSAPGVLQAARLLGRAESLAPTALVLTPLAEEAQRRAAAQVQALFAGEVILLPSPALEKGAVSPEIISSILKECWQIAPPAAQRLVAESWAEDALAGLHRPSEPPPRRHFRVRRLGVEGEQLVIETARQRGQLRAQAFCRMGSPSPLYLTLAPDVQIEAAGPPPMSSAPAPVRRWQPRLERFYGGADMQRLLHELKRETGLVRLADAEVVIDVGFGVGNRDGYEAVIEPLEKALRDLGVRSLSIGGSRKVTEELHLLPAERQIGQSGTSVNPRLILAIGISGAPQHLNYIGQRAVILAFNRDPEAPLLTLNGRQARPRVYPVVGDLFETLPALIDALQKEMGGRAAQGEGSQHEVPSTEHGVRGVAAGGA